MTHDRITSKSLHPAFLPVARAGVSWSIASHAQQEDKRDACVCSSLAQQTGGALNGRSQALEALNRASNQSYTDSLIRQMQGGSGAAVPQHVDLPAAAYQAPRPGMYSHATGATQSRMEAPRDLRVRCTVGDGGATAHATWQAALRGFGCSEEERSV